MTLNQFIEENKADMLHDLTSIVTSLKVDLLANPEEFTDYGCEEPSIDVRLCIDLNRRAMVQFGWIIRTGLVDYDPYHSEYCGASSIGIDTDPKELLEDLINQLEE